MCFFFFKQKTAYEMRISDWSSDVCSSDLTDCVEVCPVDCFHEGPNFLVIDPAECIDCTLCEPECPAHAIYAEDDVPEDQKHFLAINAELSEQWPVITERKPPPDEIGRAHV